MSVKCALYLLKISWKLSSTVSLSANYGNGLFYGVDEKLLDELQRIQNAAGKAVYGLYKHDHVGDTLQKLHWLPVRERINYKILLIVYKCLNGMGPQYLTEMLNYSNYSHNIHLVEPFMITALGERAFQKSAPKMWNSLPLAIKQCSTLPTFKKQLKTHLFQSAYGMNSQL